MQHGIYEILDYTIDAHKDEFLSEMFEDTRIKIMYLYCEDIYPEVTDLSRVSEGLWTATVVIKCLDFDDSAVFDRACREYREHFDKLEHWEFTPNGFDPYHITMKLDHDMSIYEAYQYIMGIRDKIIEDVECLKNRTLCQYQKDKIIDWFPIYHRAMKKVELELSNFTTDSEGNKGKITALNSRLKSLHSIEEKVYRKHICQYDALECFDDIAGVRCVCEYLDDVYDLLNYIKRNPLLNILEIEDKIETPSPQGYRGVHVIAGVDVFFQGRLHKNISVEIQLRTAFQDAWSTKTHELTYKKEQENIAEAQSVMKELSDKLKEADELALEIKHQYKHHGA